MNIGIFTDCYFPQINGVVSSVMTLRDELVKRGHHVTIITVKVPGHVDTTPDIIRIQSIPFSKWNEFRIGVPVYVSIYRKIKALKLDLIHTHTEVSVGMVGRIMARRLNIPVIHTYHTMYEDYTHYVMPFKIKRGEWIAKRFMITASKHYINKTDGVIAPSNKTKNALLRYGIKNEIFILPTGIKLEQFPQYAKDDPKIAAMKRELGLTGDEHVILLLGRMSIEKNMQMVIGQARTIQERVPNVRILIVGEGPYRSDLESLSHKLAVEDVCQFVGRVPWEDVGYYYAMADLFISASKTETQGLTIFEAIASRVPVVVYDDENITEYVEQNVSGRLFKDEAELVRSIEYMLTNPEVKNQMVEEAYKRIERVSCDQFGENALRIYKHVIQTQKHPDVDELLKV